MGDNDDIDERKLDQNERDTNRKKAKIKGKVTGTILKTIFIQVMKILFKIAILFVAYTAIHGLVEGILGFIRTNNMPEKTLEEFNVEKLEELVVVKGDEETGYYLGYCDDFDEKIAELSEIFIKEHNLLGTKEETIEKMIRAQIVTQFPNLGGTINQQELEEKLKKQEENDNQDNKKENGETDSNSSANINNLNGFLFIGDSITEDLENYSNLKDSITYKGVSNSTPDDWLNDRKSNGKKTFSDLPENTVAIKGISLMLGTNDVEQIDQMKKLIEKIHEKYPDKTIYVNKILPFPSSEGKDKIQKRKEFVSEIEEYCKELSYVIYIDATTSVELKKNDIHPTNEGYEILGKNIKEAIIKASSDGEDTPSIGIEADNSYASKYDGFQGNIKIRRITPNKSMGEIRDTSSGVVSTTESESFSTYGLGKKEEIPEDIKKKMEGVSMQNLSGTTYDDLSYLTIPYYDFSGNVKKGHMIVNKKLADEVLLIFQELYEIKYPIEKMEIIDNFAGSDNKTGAALDNESIEANNTSSFNDRNTVTTSGEGSTPSLHAKGQAIDINPQINPYINDDGTCKHSNATKYTKNRDSKEGWSEVERKACITKDSEIYKIFTKYGWEWLGDSNNKGDTQHFQKKSTANAKKITDALKDITDNSKDKNEEEDSSNSENTDNKLEKELNTYIKDNAASGKWSVYAKDLSKNKVVVNINDEKMQSASVIKLFIMATAFDEIYKGNISLDSVESDIRIMINASDNNATNRLIDRLGFDKINQYIKSNGYTNTEINRKMLASTSNGDNYTSAKDAGAILEKIYKGKCVSESSSSKMLGYLKEQTRTTKIPAGVPSGVQTANKTGELDNVENDAAIVFKEGTPYILVVMSSDLNDNTKARKNIVEISSKVYEGIENGGESEGITTGDKSESSSSSISSKIFDLRFVPGSIFEKYVADNDKKALEVYTIDYDGKLLTAKWSYDSNANPPLQIIKNSPINFRTVMQKYTTTYEYILDFWADIKEEEFINAFAEMVLDSEFIIAIEDNVSSNAKEVVTQLDGYEIGREVTITESVSDTIELTYADAWFVKMNKETDFTSTSIQGGGLTADANGSLGQFRTTTYCFHCNDDGSGNFGTSITAAGVPATVNHTIAVCPDYFSNPNSPLAKGKQVLINGIVYTVEDNGGGCSYFGHNWIDIYVEDCNTANIPDYMEVFIPTNIRDISESSGEDDSNRNILISSAGNFTGNVTSTQSQSVTQNEYDGKIETITTTNTVFACKYDTGNTEKTEAKFKVDEFKELFEEHPEGLESITPQWLIDLVQENAAYMTDITKYLLNELMEEEIFEDIDLDGLLERFKKNEFTEVNRNGKMSYDSLNITAEDKEILYKITSAERGGGTQEQQEYVVSVILNRVLSSEFPNTVRDVVFAPHQFEPISNGAFDRANPSATTIAAVDNVIENGGTAKTAVYFMTPAASLTQSWLSNCIFLFNDKDDSLKDTNTSGTHNFYTKESIQQELEQYMTSGGNGGPVVETAVAIHKKVRESGQYSYDMSYGKSVPVNPPHIDCSSYVSWVMLECGFEEFRGAQWSSYTFEDNPLKWEEVSLENAQPGDIVTYDGHVEIIADVNPGANNLIVYNMGGNASIGAEGTSELPESSTSGHSKSSITHILRAPSN